MCYSCVLGNCIEGIFPGIQIQHYTKMHTWMSLLRLLSIWRKARPEKQERRVCMRASTHCAPSPTLSKQGVASTMHVLSGIHCSMQSLMCLQHTSISLSSEALFTSDDRILDHFCKHAFLLRARTVLCAFMSAPCTARVGGTVTVSTLAQITMAALVL